MHRRVSRFATIAVLLAASVVGPRQAAAQQAVASASGIIVPTLALQTGRAGEVVRHSLAAAVAQATDSTRVYRRSYWLEGGVVGAALMGLIGAQIAHSIAEPRRSRDYVGGFVGGALIGFPVGALVGGLIAKRTP